MTGREATRAGVLFGLGAYIWWGAFPIYFKLLSALDPTAIVAHRILWSLALLVVALTLWRRWPAFADALRQPKTVRMLVLSSVLISCNWLAYVWAIAHQHTVAASLGYYLNPLVNVLLGVVLLKERISRLQIVAVLIAAAGVSALAIGAGRSLWISLGLAVSFSLYGLVRKVTPVQAVEGLSVETLLLSPIALGWLIWLERSGTTSIGIDPLTDLLVALSGIVTALPLLMFAAAAKRLSYSTLGFLQYVSPTIQLLIAIFLFGEKMGTAQAVAFAAIWVALGLFAAEGFRSSRAAAREHAAAGL